MARSTTLIKPKTDAPPVKKPASFLNMQSLRNQLAAFLGYSHEGNRDLYNVLGYPKQLVTEQLMTMYLRNPIANRIVHAFPAATWRTPPIIRDEAGDSPISTEKSYSPFVEAVDTLWNKHRIQLFVERADRLGSIGQFGVLLMGFRDGKRLDEPLEEGNHPLLYLQAYSQNATVVQEWDQNEQSPRFGRPTFYTLQRSKLNGQESSQIKSLRVHHSRVIHIAERLDEDEVYATPRLMPVYNHLMDLEKVLGSSAETFWLNARPGLGLFADADAQLSDESVAAMKAQAEEYEHQLRRMLTMQGVTAQQFQALVADPKPNIDGLLDVIAGGVGIPKRILIGSERGELSSSQDENNWATRITERRDNFATPSIIMPLIEKLQLTGNLPEPEGDWWTEWPEAEALGPEREANINLTKSNTLKNYVTSPGADIIVQPDEFRTKFLGLESQPEDAISLDDEELFADLPEEPVSAPAEEAAMKANAAPRTLYIRRDVVNKDDIYKWAKAQGFKGIEKDLHVTLIYSRKIVDWFKMPIAWGLAEGNMKVEGGPRQLAVFGKPGKRCVALLFQSETLKWRHKDLRAAGCGWDWGDYQAHITITYEGAEDYDFDAMEAYQGDIILGDEIWEEVKKEVEHPTINRSAPVKAIAKAKRTAPPKRAQKKKSKPRTSKKR